MGYSKSSAKREVYSNSSLPERKKKRAISNKQPNLIPKATRKRKTNNNNNKTPKVSRKKEMKTPRDSRRKEILKIRAEINAKETKQTIAKINKAKCWFFEKIKKKK